jgi:plastocyanin
MQTTHSRPAAALLCAFALSGFVGCGKDDSISALGGGAHSPVAVTIIPKAAAGGGGAGGADAAAAGYGHIKGKVTISGAVPTMPPLVSAAQVKPDDKSVCVVDRIPNQTLVVNGNAVQNVFIYLSKKPAGTKVPETPAAEVTMDHKYCTFVPHALIVMTGQPIRILNDDAIAHNVHTKPTRSGEFNSGIGATNREGILTTYKNAERQPAKVICDYHTWMSAWHLPLDHPYGAVTNESGEFEIRDLPAGKHEFVIWHEGSELAKKTVTIEVDQTAPLDLEFTAADFKVGAANRADHKTVVLSMNH